MAKSREMMLARELRRAGSSIKEIASKLRVSKSSASLWCRDIVLREEQIKTLFHREIVGREKGRIKSQETHRIERQRRYEHFHRLGYEQISALNNHDLFLIGIALYWSEGSKNDGRVLLTNSDPHIVRLFLRWIQEFFGVQSKEITCRVAINIEHLDRRDEIERYWSDIVQLPQTQFTKTTIIKSKWAKTYENREKYHGVMEVRVQKSTNLSYQIMGTIDGLRGMS